MKKWSHDYKKGYSRGFNAAKRGKWPSHVPPEPPHGVLREILSAVRKLRDESDKICSVLEEDDEFSQRLAPAIDGVDMAMKKLSTWITLVEPEEQPPTPPHDQS